MTITASQVSELRQKTGVGLMDCKKALIETNGNVDEAVKKLREKGLAKAAKKSDRSTNEGRIFLSENESNTEAIILELNCETDFVAGNTAFAECGTILTSTVLNGNINTIEELEAAQIDNASYKDFLASYIMKLGENISVKQFKRTKGSFVSTYSHLHGKIGVQVTFNNKIDSELAKSIAMQIAATNPNYIKPEDINQEEINNEKEIIKTQAENEGKPQNVVEKIVEGRIQKYYKEVCLLEQPFIKDDSSNVKNTLPKDTTVIEFSRIAVN